MHLFNSSGFWLFVLFSLPVTSGQSNLICSPQTIEAQAGDDVILPCRLDPPISASSRTVEWTKPGLDPEYIHVHQDGRLVYQSQNPLYNYRTALFVDQLINGNVSLKLFRVKASDAGKYKCFLPSMWKEAFIQLKVDDASSSPSSCAACIAISVLSSFMFTLSVALLVWKWRQSKNERKRGKREEEQQFMEERKKIEHLEKTKSKLYEELQKKEEEQKNTTQVIKTLKELEKDLQGNLKQQVNIQMQKIEKLVEENDKKIRSVDKEITEKEGDKTANKAQGYLKLKEMFKEANWELEETKKEQQQLQMIIDKLTKKTIDMIQRTE